MTYALSDQAVGCVAGQSPEPGWITRETDIMLILSAEPVEVPPLTGLTVDGARALAEAEGLKIGAVSEGYSADAPAGTVIAQSVASGEVVAAGTEIGAHHQPAAPGNVLSGVKLYPDRAAGRDRGAPGDRRPFGNDVYGLQRRARRRRVFRRTFQRRAGLHTVREYMDGVLMAETQVLFE